jgi:hypothetical protein
VPGREGGVCPGLLKHDNFTLNHCEGDALRRIAAQGAFALSSQEASL